MNICAVIMPRRSAARLWPLSRTANLKKSLTLDNKESIYA